MDVNGRQFLRVMNRSVIFDFSLFPYRARQMTAYSEELAFMDTQLENLQASIEQECNEVTMNREIESNRNAV